MESHGNPYREAARDEMEKIYLTENERYLYLREAMAASDATTQYNSAIRKGRAEQKEKSLKSAIQMCKNYNMTQEETIINLQNFFSFSENEAKTGVDEYWDN